MSQKLSSAAVVIGALMVKRVNMSVSFILQLFEVSHEAGRAETVSNTWRKRSKQQLQTMLNMRRAGQFCNKGIKL